MFMQCQGGKTSAVILERQTLESNRGIYAKQFGVYHSTGRKVIHNWKTVMASFSGVNIPASYPPKVERLTLMVKHSSGEVMIWGCFADKRPQCIKNNSQM